MRSVHGHGPIRRRRCKVKHNYFLAQSVYVHSMLNRPTNFDEIRYSLNLKKDLGYFSAQIQYRRRQSLLCVYMKLSSTIIHFRELLDELYL